MDKALQEILQEAEAQLSAAADSHALYEAKMAYLGKTGKVVSTSPKAGRVTVQGVNLQKRHQKARKANAVSQIVEREGAQKSVRLSEVVKGDVVVVRQGDSIPVDGVVLSGDSFIDKSAITGESLPVEVGAGDFVTSASVNKGNVLRIRAEKVGEDK